MPRYNLRLEGRPGERKGIDAPDVATARNEAVRFLGATLAASPDFADEGHWRVHVEDESGRSLLHVIVATVTARGARGRD